MDISRQLAHELEAPLTALELLVRRLIAEYPANETAASCLAEIDGLRDLVAGFLSLSAPPGMPDMPDRPDILDTFELRAVLDRVSKRFEPAATSKDVSLELTCRDTEVRADSRATERILANLLDNAVKFSRPGKRVRILAARRNGYAHVEIHDEGPGIPAEAIERVFEPFFRLDREREGSGLGLAISKRLAEAQRTELRCTSEPGQGSTFTLVLPAPSSERS